MAKSRKPTNQAEDGSERIYYLDDRQCDGGKDAFFMPETPKGKPPNVHVPDDEYRRLEAACKSMQYWAEEGNTNIQGWKIYQAPPGAPAKDTTLRVLEMYDGGITKPAQILEYVPDVAGETESQQRNNISQIISRYRTKREPKA